MKKTTILFAILAIFSISIYAQDASISNKSTYTTAGGSAADTIDATATVTKTFEVNVSDLFQYSAAIRLTKISGTPDTVIVREYCSQDGLNYSTTPLTTDTIVTGNASNYTILNTITDCGCRFLKYQTLSDGDVMKMGVQYQIKAWKK